MPSNPTVSSHKPPYSPLHTAVIRLAAVVCLAGGLTALAGYAADLPALTRLGAASRPLHPLSATLFVLFGGYLAACSRASVSRRKLHTFGVALKLLCATALVAQLFGFEVPFTPKPTGIPFDQLDPRPINLAMTFAFGCVALATILRNGQKTAARRWMVIPLIPVFWASYLSLAANFYRVEYLNSYFLHTLIPLPAAILFAVLLVGYLASQPREGFMATLSRRYMGGVVARIAFPVILLVPFTVGWIRIRAMRTGTYDLAAAFSQFATTNIVIFGVFIWFSAHMLNRIDARRQKTLESLQQANGELQRVNGELQRVNEALEAKIAEQIRTEDARQKTELQLFQSQKMEAMGTLATGIAHDFNNILTVIQLNAENAHEAAVKVAPDAVELHRELLDIRKSGSRAADVVRQIMTFGRKTPGNKRRLLAGDAIADAAEMLRHTLPESVTLQVDVPPTPLPLYADPTMVQQVLLNLGTNASHAMAQDGGRLDIGAATRDIPADQAHAWGIDHGYELAPGRYIRIRVRDTGHGMDEDTRKKIFDPFFTTKPPGKGTGLGLSVALGIMRLHGGGISVDSAPGRGTTFDLYFPFPADA